MGWSSCFNRRSLFFMKHCQIEKLTETNQWRVKQTLCDPDEKNDWELIVLVDLPQSDDREEPVISLEKLGPIGLN